MATRPDGAIPRRAMATYHDFLRSLLSDRDRFFEEVVEGVGLRSKLRYAVVTIVALSGFFGLVAGAYSGPAQAVSAAIKLPFLFFATFAVCFPAFFVVQVLVGSRLRLLQVAVLVRLEKHTSGLQSLAYLVYPLLLEKKKIANSATENLVAPSGVEPPSR